jgi:uracil-DNA glycosylase family 4
MRFWTPWSPDLADELRRYLRQQIDLGGPELVASGRVAVTPSHPEAKRSEAEESGEGGKEVLPSVPDDGTPESNRRWLKDAPPIPGPGLNIVPPPFELGDPFAAMETLDAVAAAVKVCTRCPLHRTRTNDVFGEGDPQARLMCIGEGPGETEDRLGRPFVGRAGELLDKLLAAIDLTRAEVYIANIVKSRPPQNRKPLPDEVAACIPFLYRQIAIIRPRVILALGGTAGESLLGVKKSLTELRGRVHRFNGIPLVVTYHPAALLRNPNWKKPTWDDVRIARQLLDI